MHRPQFCSHPRLMAVAAAAALLALGNPALAAPITFGNITLDATYALGGGSTVNGMTDPDAQLYTTSGGADYYLFKTVGNDNVFFHTYGNAGANTYFGARASGQGYFDAFTRASYSGSFIASAAAPTFNFHVDSGDVGLSGTGTGLADLLLEIRINGVAIARDHTTITRNGTTSTCTNSGLGVLDNYIECTAPDSDSASGGGGNYSVVLAGIGAGETFTLDYDIVATVSGNLTAGVTTEIVCDQYGGYGGYGGEVAATLLEGGNCREVQVQVFGQGIARSGDPFNLSSGPTTAPGNPGELTVNGANAVPEPGSLALAALALAGAGALRRRRAQGQGSGGQG